MHKPFFPERTLNPIESDMAEIVAKAINSIFETTSGWRSCNLGKTSTNVNSLFFFMVLNIKKLRN